MKNLHILFLLLCGISAATLNAQPQTVHTTSSAGATSENGRLSVVIGQPFFTQFPAGDYDFSLGVAQAQWTRDTVYDVITYNTPYTENQFNLPAQTQSHVDSVYAVNGGIYNYDLLRTLYLIVCPEKVTDLTDAGIKYDAVAVTGHCWTKQNLRSPVAGALTYTSPMHPTVDVEKYGLLYTWQTALNNVLPTGDDTVQGICPTNWYIPNEEEINSLYTNDIPSLCSTEGWVNSTVNTNSTGFTAYPAGKYNSALSRFEGMGTETSWWSTVNLLPVSASSASEVVSVMAYCASYYCGFLVTRQHPTDDALSVRCVMKNEWPK